MFTTLEELERDFNKRIEAEEDASQKAELRAQKAEARADFKIQQAEERARVDAETREAQVRARERQAWVKEALVEFPLAQKRSELVKGETEEDIRKSARDAHEFILAIQEEAKTAALASVQTPVSPQQGEVVRQAVQAYGEGGVGGGATPQEISEREKRMQKYVAGFNDGRRGNFFGERIDVSQAETDEYVRLRGGPHLLERVLGTAIQKYGEDSPMVTAMRKQVTGIV